VNERRIDVSLDRIDVGREEDSCAGRAHLVDVVHDVRPPDVVRVLYGELRLLLRERIPVPVVVMADVELVQPWRRRALIGRPHVLHIELGDPVQPVRIERGDVEQDDIVEDLEHVGIIRRREPVQHARCREAAADLGGVDLMRNQDHGPHVAQHRLQLSVVADRARVRQLALHGEVLVEAGVILGARHGQHDKGSSHRRGAERVELHPGARLGELLPVAEELIPVGELAIGADLEAEV
jgi:hypothetical protein